MSADTSHYDVIVIGSGPAGQKAAIEAAGSHRSVLVVEIDSVVGGACVRRGTIPSKTLREAAISVDNLRKRTSGNFRICADGDLKLSALMMRVGDVIKAHESHISGRLKVAGVDVQRGRASFLSNVEIEVVCVGGAKRRVTAETIVIATGSRPRNPPEIPIDHANILDSDSILSLAYLPESLLVVGGGVIASEYATIFGAIGTKVTMVDSAPRPLGFLDPEITDRFLHAFRSSGQKFIGGVRVKKMEWDGIACVRTELDNGEVIETERVLYALGRVANVEGLNIAAAGLATTSRGHIEVDADGRTRVPNIFAAGDVIGPPGLASTSMDQGRRAIRNACRLDVGARFDVIPSGIYTIPEMASVGLTEQQAVEKFGSVIVGRCHFSELARGHIAANEDGFLKLITDAEGKKISGVQIVGEGATELVHLGQMAIISNWNVESFIDAIFNFPTLAEAYRIAAFDVAAQRSASLPVGAH